MRIRSFGGAVAALSASSARRARAAGAISPLARVRCPRFIATRWAKRRGSNGTALTFAAACTSGASRSPSVTVAAASSSANSSRAVRSSSRVIAAPRRP